MINRTLSLVLFTGMFFVLKDVVGIEEPAYIYMGATLLSILYVLQNIHDCLEKIRKNLGR